MLNRPTRPVACLAIASAVVLTAAPSLGQEDPIRARAARTTAARDERLAGPAVGDERLALAGCGRP